MAESESAQQPISYDIDVESFVLYRSRTGDSYHTRSECASEANVPPELDAANDLLNSVEMYRVGELEEELSSDNLCRKCANRLRRTLGFEN